jgi:MFS family permease
VLRDDFGVGYDLLGLAMTAFNAVSGIAHVPMGFIVDRFGARPVLVAGLIVESLAFIAVGLTQDYWLFVAALALAGLGNAVYHPADYAILSASIDERRMGRAFSIHTFAGYAGGAIAPAFMWTAITLGDWRVAPLGVGIAGLAVAALLLAVGGELSGRSRRPTATTGGGGVAEGLRLLLTPPILMCFLFFIALAMANGALTQFGVAAMVDLGWTDLDGATAALTAFLVGSALGILVGGVIADRTRHHERVAVAGFIATGSIVLAIGLAGPGAWLLVPVLGGAGLLFGMIMPSRDMLVRAATPPDALGKVFGFVSVGLNIGAAITPAFFGWVLEQGDPRWLFFLSPAFMLLALFTVIGAGNVRRRHMPA